MSDATTLQARALAVLDLDDLREHILPPTALLMVITDALAVWLYLPADNYQWRQSLLLVSAGVVSFAVWLFGRKRPLIGAIALVLTQYFLAPVTAALLPGAEVFLLCLATVSAIVLAWPVALLVAAAGAVLCQLAIHFWLQPLPHLDLAILTYCLIGGWLFFSAHSYQGILRWSWQRHANALNLSEQLRDRQGQLNSTVKALDLAYRLLQRTNHELAEAREEAEEARHLKEQFAANISHELRTPLNLIMGFSEMMHLSPHVYGDVNWTTPLRRDIAQLYTASRHLLQLVDDVLDLSRLNAERMPLRKELCSLSDIVNEAVATVRDLVRGRPLSIRAELDPTVPRLLLDGTRIRQALLNLLNNGIRFTDQGEIAVQTERRDHEVLISISDTGIGIPEEELENIFDEFYQTEAAATRPSAGMGLGLAISKRFVQLHGGRIWAESTLGSGSTFHISLPLDASRPIASRLRMSSAASIPSNPYAESVLLLNGQFDVARMLARHLSGYKVLCATDAGEAQHLMEEHHPRAAICNLSLATMRALTGGLLPRDLPKSVPLLFCTIPCAAWRAEMLQVYGSLQKPVERQELLTLLGGLEGARDILVIDDDLGFVQVVTRMLQGSDPGYRVRSAFSGNEGLAEMRHQRPDAVLLDLRMPEQDGAAVLAVMRDDPTLKNVPVIVVTAMDVEEDSGGLEWGLIGLVQRQNWRLGDSLKALEALLPLARPRYATPAPDQLELATGLPG